jgi:hypothetical protein
MRFTLSGVSFRIPGVPDRASTEGSPTPGLSTSEPMGARSKLPSGRVARLASDLHYLAKFRCGMPGW